MNLRNIPDADLLSTTKNLVQQEREILTELLHHLAEVQRRKLFSPRFTSLFDYATKELKYSSDQAARRIAAMKLLSELPEIETSITDGSLSLTTLGLAQTHFRNEKRVLESENASDRKSTDESSRPKIDKVEKLETLKQLAGKSTREASRVLIDRSSDPDKLLAIESIRAVSATLNEVKFHVNDQTLEKLMQLRGLIGHAHPGISNGELIEMLCDIALKKLSPARQQAKEKLNNSVPHDSSAQSVSKMTAQDFVPAVEPTKDAKPKTQTRRPSNLLRNEVWRTAEGKCELCRSTFMLEIDHRVPVALGGRTEKNNLRLLCRNCNQRESIRIFGTYE